MNVCIVGLGETGATITSLINAQKKGVLFNVLDPSESITGRVLDIEHAVVNRNNKIVLNNFKYASESDFLFYCAGVRNKKGSDRLSVVQTNKEIIHQVFDRFKLKKSCKIIVVTNPVEVISQSISDYFNHQLTVVGTGTGLDTLRLTSLLSELLGVEPGLVKTTVIGEHGSRMVPIYSNTTINERPIFEYLSPKSLSALTDKLKGIATEIRSTEAATKYGVGQFAVYVMNSFLSKKPTVIPLSVRISKAYQKKLTINEELFLSLPCRIVDGNMQVASPIHLADEELVYLKDAAQQILRINKS